MGTFLLDGRNKESLDYTEGDWSKIYFQCETNLLHIQHAILNYAQMPNQIENIGALDTILITNLDEILHPVFIVPLGKGLFGDNDHADLCAGVKTRVHDTLIAEGFAQWISSFDIVAIDGKWTTISFVNHLKIDFTNTDVGIFLGFPASTYELNNETLYADYAYDPWRNYRQVYIFTNFTSDNYMFDHTYATQGLGNPWAILPMRFSDIDFSSTTFEESSAQGLYNPEITAVDFNFIELCFFYRKQNNYFPYPFRSHEITFKLSFSD